jgi:hypothetical protein
VVAAEAVVMVEVGPLAVTYCPNGNTCPHDIAQHRYEPDRQRWVCTEGRCWENPYRVIRICDPLSASMLNAEAAAQRWREMRSAHPEATFEVVEYPHIGVDDRPSWWQRLWRWR